LTNVRYVAAAAHGWLTKSLARAKAAMNWRDTLARWIRVRLVGVVESMGNV
jgi:hypothetical protein